MKKKWYDYLPSIDDIMVLYCAIVVIVSPIVLVFVFGKYIIQLLK
jgi:hypothetical protein